MSSVSELVAIAGWVWRAMKPCVGATAVAPDCNRIPSFADPSSRIHHLRDSTTVYVRLPCQSWSYALIGTASVFGHARN